MTVDEAGRLAVDYNPRIRALVYELFAAESAVAGAYALTNPTITHTPGLTRAGSDEELLVSQPLEINGVRTARGAIARARLQAVQAEALSEFRGIVYHAKASFSNLVQAHERRILADELSNHMEELDRIAQRQAELGSRPGIERTQTKIEAARARQQATLARAEYQSALADFNTAVGRDSQEAVVAQPLAFSASGPVDKGALIESAFASRSEISASLAKSELFRNEARLARAEGLPDVAPQYRAESISRSPKSGGFGIGISIPLFDHGSRRNRVKQAEESQLAENVRLVDLKNRIRQEVLQAITRLEAAETVLKEFEGGLLEEAKKLLEATRKGFQLGETSLVTILEAQRTYRSVQSEYIEALVSQVRAKVELERATGAVPASLLKGLRAAGGKK